MSRVGAIESSGDHKGEVYGGIYPADHKPIWFFKAPKLMDHYKAVSWAKENGGTLPTKEQGDYLTTLKGKGAAFTELFNCDEYPDGYFWLTECGHRLLAYYQRLSDGNQSLSNRDYPLPVLCVRR